jgi:hypothetical protein
LRNLKKTLGVLEVSGVFVIAGIFKELTDDLGVFRNFQDFSGVLKLCRKF